MSQFRINKALSTHLQAMGKITAYENAPFTPTELPYLAEAYLPATVAPVGMENTSHNEYTGIYQVMVSVPRDGFKAVGYDLAVEVEIHFMRGEILSDADGKVLRIERVEQGPSLTAGSRWNIPVSINYRSFIPNVV